MEPLRPNDRRAKNAISMVWAVLAVSIITTLFSIVDEIYINVVDYSTLDSSLINVFYLVLGGSGILYTAIYIGSAVTFIMWFRRAYYNLHQLRGNLSYGEGWAAGGWFVPIMNLFIPYRIMKELYVVTNNIFSQDLQTCTIRLKTDYLGWWWALWIITGILSQISLRAALSGDVYGISFGFEIIATLLSIPLTVLTVMIIKDYANIESALAEVAESEIYNISEENKPMTESENL